MSQSITTHPSFGFARSPVAEPPASAQDALEARFALAVAAALTQRNAHLDGDIAERLRFAREGALARVVRSSNPSADRAARPTAPVPNGSRWMNFAPVLPALALIAGLLLIQRWQNTSQISTAAEVDAALLSDDLPPAAYGDPGFAEFLKSPSE